MDYILPRGSATCSLAVFVSSVIFVIICAVAGGCTALFLVRSCKWLPPDEYLVPLVIKFQVMVDLSTLLIFFGVKATYNSSRFLI